MDRRRLSRRERFREFYCLRVQFWTKVLASWFTATLSGLGRVECGREVDRAGLGVGA